MNNTNKVLEHVWTATETKRFLAASKGQNKWLRASQFASNSVIDLNKTVYKAGAKIMSKVLLEFNRGIKIDWMLMEVDVPLVVYVGEKCQFEVKRDAKGNMYFRIVDAGFVN